MTQGIKNSPASAGDGGLIPGSGRSPGGGHGNPFQYSCLETPMDRGAWWTTAYRVTKHQTQLKQLNTHAYMHRVVGTTLKSDRTNNITLIIQRLILLGKLSGEKNIRIFHTVKCTILFISCAVKPSSRYNKPWE